MITRDEAITVAMKAIKANPPQAFQGKGDFTFEPEEWLIEALQQASLMGDIDAMQTLANTAADLMRLATALNNQAMTMQREIITKRYDRDATAQRAN